MESYSVLSVTDHLICHTGVISVEFGTIFLQVSSESVVPEEPSLQYALDYLQDLEVEYFFATLHYNKSNPLD